MGLVLVTVDVPVQRVRPPRHGHRQTHQAATLHRDSAKKCREYLDSTYLPTYQPTYLPISFCAFFVLFFNL